MNRNFLDTSFALSPGSCDSFAQSYLARPARGEVSDAVQAQAAPSGVAQEGPSCDGRDRIRQDRWRGQFRPCAVGAAGEPGQRLDRLPDAALDRPRAGPAAIRGDGPSRALRTVTP